MAQEDPALAPGHYHKVIEYTSSFVHICLDSRTLIQIPIAEKTEAGNMHCKEHEHKPGKPEDDMPWNTVAWLIGEYEVMGFQLQELLT